MQTMQNARGSAINHSQGRGLGFGRGRGRVFVRGQARGSGRGSAGSSVSIPASLPSTSSSVAVTSGRVSVQGRGRTGRGRGLLFSSGGRSLDAGRKSAGSSSSTTAARPRKKESIFSEGDRVFLKEQGGNILPARILAKLPGRKLLYRIKVFRGDEEDEDTTEIQEEVPSAMIFGENDTLPKARRSKKPPPFEKSEAKKHLLSLFKDDKHPIHSVSDWHDAHAMHTSFLIFGRGDFAKKAEKLYQRFKVDMAVSKEDDLAMEKYKTNNPRAELDFHGNPYFDTSFARLQLSDDVKEGNIGKPAVMREQNDDYKAFSKYAFRNHLYRMKRRQKEDVAWQFRRNKEGFQAHHDRQAEVQEEQYDSNNNG